MSIKDDIKSTFHIDKAEGAKYFVMELDTAKKIFSDDQVAAYLLLKDREGLIGHYKNVPVYIVTGALSKGQILVGHEQKPVYDTGLIYGEFLK